MHTHKTEYNKFRSLLFKATLHNLHLLKKHTVGLPNDAKEKIDVAHEELRQARCLCGKWWHWHIK